MCCNFQSSSQNKMLFASCEKEQISDCLQISAFLMYLCCLGLWDGKKFVKQSSSHVLKHNEWLCTDWGKLLKWSTLSFTLYLEGYCCNALTTSPSGTNPSHQSLSPQYAVVSCMVTGRWFKFVFQIQDKASPWVSNKYIWILKCSDPNWVIQQDNGPRNSKKLKPLHKLKSYKTLINQ